METCDHGLEHEADVHALSSGVRRDAPYSRANAAPLVDNDDRGDETRRSDRTSRHQASGGTRWRGFEAAPLIG